MRCFHTVLLGIGLVAGVVPAFADTIPCTPGTQQECRTNFTCSAQGFCSGDPINEGQECTTDTTSGGCMTTPLCNKNGVCAGTVPVPDGTECTFAAFGKCSVPGHCMKIPLTNLSFCMGATEKTCPQPSDPCKLAVCNPQTGDCFTGDKCLTVSGCETCNGGTCQPTRIGQPCTNAEGDFNSCTTNDQCVILEGRGLCMGEPLSGPVPTPTMGPTLCAGDCNFDGQTTVDELVTMARVLLGEAPFAECLLGDANHNGKIEVDDIVAGIASVTGNCHGVGASLH